MSKRAEPRSNPTVQRGDVHHGPVVFERGERPSEAGFSLIELVVVVGVSAIVMAILTLGIRQVGESYNLQRAANIVVNELRRAQAAAMAEGVDYAVEFYTGSAGVAVWKDVGGVWTASREVLPPEWPDSIEIASGEDDFPDCDAAIDASHSCAVFQKLGDAAATGEVIVQARGSGVTLRVVVESAASGRVKVER
ncbi:MAG TPA: prepilin-type N-terminal cleavage/methylation domain-containing protein [bacterium]|nr:prepilin-type N-terminal cleavage/methylation domain-containing protein [bacterium]